MLHQSQHKEPFYPSDLSEIFSLLTIATLQLLVTLYRLSGVRALRTPVTGYYSSQRARPK
jgi:hypothetical protein